MGPQPCEARTSFDTALVICTLSIYLFRSIAVMIIEDAGIGDADVISYSVMAASSKTLRAARSKRSSARASLRNQAHEHWLGADDRSCAQSRCLVTGLIAHSHFADPNQIAHFLKNLAMAGDLLLLLAFGAGPWSVDARCPRAV
jgi:hypothetical protein